jgi:hypothetical protein
MNAATRNRMERSYILSEWIVYTDIGPFRIARFGRVWKARKMYTDTVWSGSFRTLTAAAETLVKRHAR